VLELLIYLVEHRGQLVTKQEVLGELWAKRFVSESALTSSVYEARTVLGDAAGEERFIQTVHGRGYRFVAEVGEIGEGGEFGEFTQAPPLQIDDAPPIDQATERVEPGVHPASRLPASSGSRATAPLGHPLVAGLALVSAMVAGLLWNARPSASGRDVRPVTRLPLAWASVPLASRLGVDREIEFAALSPDGRSIVYRSAGMLHVRRMAALRSEPLSATEGGKGPFFSPDGSFVGYFTDTALKKVALDGGGPETIAEVSAGWSGTWGTDDTIVFGRSGLTDLWRVPAAGGSPERLTTRASETIADHDWPVFLPDDKTVLFANAEASYALGEAQIIALSLVTGESKILVEGGTYPRYSPSGHLLYAHDGALFAARFDPKRLELLGRPARVVEGVQQGRNGSAQYSVARDGTLLYVHGGSNWTRTRPVWVDRSGRETETAVAPNHFAYQALSRDGTRIAAEVRDPNGADLWIYDLVTGSATRLTFDRAGVSDPVWSLDDSEIYFASGVEGARGKLYRKRSDGTGTVERLADAEVKPRSLSPAGHLVGVGFGLATDRDIVSLQLSAGSQPQALVATTARELEPQISSDGNWIAYVSDQSGRNEVYVRPFPNVGDGRWQVSTRGGLFPRWHPMGGELFYLEESSLMAVEVAGEGVFRSGVPERIVDGPYVGTLGGWGGFGVSPDGERFLMFKQVIDPDEAGELVLVQNWFDELERLAPAL
jgi:serine/threonine-protein kinase